MNRDRPEFEYDIQLRAKAGTAATFRGAVALYIIYLGWTILRGYFDGSSPLPVWVSWTAGIGFITAALAFGVYTLKRYRSDLEAAKLPPAEKQEDEDES